VKLKWLALVTIVLALFLVAGVVGAQETTPDVIGTIPTPEEAGGAFYAALLGLIASVSGGALVTTLVSFVKRLPPFVGVDAGLIKVVASVVVVGLGWAANIFGLQALFSQAAQIIVAVLIVLTGGVSVSAGLWYEKALSGVPYFGTTRHGESAANDAQS